MSTASDEGRTRPVNKEKWKRMKLQILRHKAKKEPQLPNCSHISKPCYSCQKLTMTDIQAFYKELYSTVEKVKQDIYILQFCEGSKPKSGNHHCLSIKYFVPTVSKEKLRVCRRAFLGITDFSGDRLERIVKNHLLHNEIPRERRGGNKNKNDDIKASIKEFIGNLQSLDQSDLNMKKLYKIYCTQNPNLNVKLCFFRNYVNKIGNLSFQTPKTDVCAMCIRFKEVFQNSKSDDEKALILEEHRLHVPQMKAFCDSLKSSIKNAKYFSSDDQKNLALLANTSPPECILFLTN